MVWKKRKVVDRIEGRQGKKARVNGGWSNDWLEEQGRHTGRKGKNKRIMRESEGVRKRWKIKGNKVCCCMETLAPGR